MFGKKNPKSGPFPTKPRPAPFEGDGSYFVEVTYLLEVSARSAREAEQVAYRATVVHPQAPGAKQTPLKAEALTFEG